MDDAAWQTGPVRAIWHREGMENDGALDLSHGVLAFCADCGSEQILVPVDRSGGFCCTLCDAGIFLSEIVAGEHGPMAQRALKGVHAA